MMYLITKHLGITLRKRVTIISGKMDSDQKQDMLETLWLLGGLFDASETANKNSVLFPINFSNETITKNDFYQGGSLFKKIEGRLRDTIKQKNSVVNLFDYDGDTVKLRRNFKEIITEEYLNGNKISLKHFSSWIFRFMEFDFETEPSDIEFTRIVTKLIKNLFKITKTDFLWLFDDDIVNNSFSLSVEPTTGKYVRDLFKFTSELKPEINALHDSSENSVIKYSTVTRDTINKYIQITGGNPSEDLIKEVLLMKKQIVLTGVPGVGKSRFLNALKENFDETEMIQFHENYSYEDFIGGETLFEGNIKTKKGIFLEFIEKAKKVGNEDKKYLFIIDELNRGNISQIFGETILALDRGYQVTLSKPIEQVTTLSIPDNVYIASSMNTSDRNIAFLDLAIRRRFAFIDLIPNYDALSAITKYAEFDLGNVLKQINQEIINTVAKEELLLGHSYFLSDDVKQGDLYIWTDKKLQLQFNFVILPTLKEYTFSNTNALTTIIGTELSKSLLDLNDFISAFEDQFGIQ
ncbi:MAG: AAA family ATPase [Algoriella sp.]